MFKIIKEDTETSARLGSFQTNHGSVKTPSFFPVATQAAVKGLGPRELCEIGIDGLLVNAYHLYLRPGVEIIKKCGGLHKFMGFNKTIITDSGGYQIFSLENLRKVNDEGVQFQSHLDGETIFLTPEVVIEVQLDLDSDVVVPLDECIKFDSSYELARIAMERTIRWAKKSKDCFDKKKTKSLFFGIIQGGVYTDLRKECLQAICDLNPDGLCIGGLSVGEPKDLRYNILSFVHENSAKNHLRYFMGYGKPVDILEAVNLGVDLFDCVVPTRYGRTGTAFTHRGEIVVRNAPCRDDTKPLDEKCQCHTCRNFSRAYLRHLINANEMLGTQLITYHNVFWYNDFMHTIRKAIDENIFLEFKKDFLASYH
jgi:queuine tRNA-ribosyltransferase